VEKPFKPNIKITKSNDFFEAYMPPYFLRLSFCLPTLFFTIPILSVFCLVLVGGLSISLFLLIKDIYFRPNKIIIILKSLFSIPLYQLVLSVFSLLISIPICVLFAWLSTSLLFYMIDLVFSPPLTKRYLRISEGRVVLTRDSIWQKNKVVSSFSIEEISKIILIREHFYEDDGSRSKKEAKLEIIIESELTEKQRLNIKKIHGNDTLIQKIDKTIIEFDNAYRHNADRANAELAWLAYEISEWLDKPLTIVEPS
jgi:hypothetical protein